MEEVQEKRLNLFVKGRVQGVGFRYYTYQIGMTLILKGWVRNRFNGDVEVLAEGPKNRLNLLLREIRKGPPYSHVDDIDITWSDPVGDLPPFTILETH